MAFTNTKKKKATYSDRRPNFFCDAPLTPSGDPTGTRDIRRRFGNLAEMRFRKVRTILQQAIVAQDILGLKPQTVSVLAIAASLQSAAKAAQEQHGNLQAQPDANKVKGLQSWFDDLLRRVVVEDGSWMRPMIALSYNRSVARAMRLTKSNLQPPDTNEQINSLVALCLVELQGICEAVSQRVIRAASLALLHNENPTQGFSDMSTAIQAIGVTRTKAMAELMVVKAFTTGTLDQFEQAGIKRVGAIPETFVKVKGDARFHDAPAGPGSRIGREEPPSRSTIYRISRVQRRLEQFGQVNVQTAGDEDVCPICQDIEDENPYTIDEARSLIPAHPRCRCAFVPLDEDVDEEF